MGGGVAIDFSFSFPQRVRALIPYDAVVGGFPWSPEFSAALAAVQAKAKEAGLEAAKALWSQNPMFKLTLQRSHSALPFREMLDTYSGLHWLGKDSTRRYDPPAFRRLEEIQAPTLVLVGEDDVADMQAVATALTQRIQGARKQILSNVGHLGNLEDPEGFNQAVLGLISLVVL
jgi:pimeloyl-ACP methyl ester carboxylesterase